MVLLDSFAGVVVAVLYGRVVFDNLKKTNAYLLPSGSYSEFWTVLANPQLVPYDYYLLFH
jgi:sodium/potassium-transporting ATPase subunit alpha